jgi:hypothetical protein
MEKEIATTHLLTFLSLADTATIATFKTPEGNTLGEALAKTITDYRAALKAGGFTQVAQLLQIKGMTQARIASLLPLFEEKERHPGYLASHTLVAFKGAAPDFKSLSGRAILEKFVDAVPSQPEKGPLAKDITTYELFYKPEQDKEKLLTELKGLTGFLHFDTRRVFAVQVRNNTYWATLAGNEVYLKDFSWASKFSIRGVEAPAHGYPYSPPGPFPNSFLSMSIHVRNHAGPTGMLSFNPASSSTVRTLTLAQQPTATALEKFDPEGIFLPPVGVQQNYFKSFTLMNYVRQNIAGGDPRQFIGCTAPANPNPNINYFLRGTGSQASWEPGHQLRYVDVIENMALKVIHNPTHTPQMGLDAYMAVMPGNVVAVQKVPIGAPVPANAKFDMYVHYGYWPERSNIVCKVVLRYRPNQIVGMDASGDDVALSPADTLSAQHFFYVENGWGGTYNHVNLKTHAGKYLKCWQDLIVADSVVPYIYEQFQVIIP